MSRSSDIRILEVNTSTQRIRYRQPMKFGGRVVRDALLLDVAVQVETRDGHRGCGRGSMPLGNVWAWPSPSLTNDQTLAAMLELGERMAHQAGTFRDTAHPLEITAELARCWAPLAEQVQREQRLSEAIPKLAQLVAASPWEAAVFDGQGKALQRNAYDLLGPEHIDRDLAHWLGPEFTGEYLDRYTRRAPAARLPLYHLVGALDPLTAAEQTQRVNDGLPETLHEWILAEGLTHLKIKLNGDDLLWDVQRVVSVEQVAAEAWSAHGNASWVYSLDFNEKCADVQYVLDFLAQVRQRAPAAFERIQYIEQPTSRDLRAHADQRMHAAARIKPVVIDEALVDLDSLLLRAKWAIRALPSKPAKDNAKRC